MKARHHLWGVVITIPFSLICVFRCMLTSAGLATQGLQAKTMTHGWSMCVLLIFSVFIGLGQGTPPWPNSYWDIPGDYCSARYPSGQCCNGRQDPCSVPILGTLCYCDTFCNRTENSDCCPDYFTHCEGLSDYQYALAKPEEVIKLEDLECPQGSALTTDGSSPKCFSNGRLVSTRDKVEDNCNICKCQVSPSNSNCMELICETKLCALDQRTMDELDYGFASNQYSWKPTTNYSNFWGLTLEDAISKRLGTVRPEAPVNDMSAIEFVYRSEDLPKSFDARDKWRGKITPVLDQGECGASWAFSTISMASDRFAIEGQTEEALSPQSLISCNTQGQNGCRGGSVDRAWNFLRRYGTVPEECYPFDDFRGYGSGDEASSCRIPRGHKSRPLQAFENCKGLDKRRGLFRTQPAYKVGRRNTREHPRRTEEDIMFEIMTHGPVQALMEVPSDFFMYQSGIYQRTNLASQSLTGFHSVKLIGWGEERGIPYWICMNSWGEDWGESGLVRIRRGVNEVNIEDFVVGVWVQTERRVRGQQRERRQRRLSRMAARRARASRLRRRQHDKDEQVMNHYQVG
ncbi:uncharacterized peptidase C1-like protein F26E4.3 isoform X2 [Tigriopus californicus]|uniref:uncharacterized peptidase C1-like protein F26E4.3 isoform X2 n=1 Tax=Tigriopus californicus TaxID=6832 RepID=UPI0027DA9F01|nr:uncharacterized peptidase C1-like protein F26E4.3 isoform X2 [Tigriopus californicus]